MVFVTLEYVDEFKYLEIRFKRTFWSALENKRAQSVLDLHILRHHTLSIDHILRLFDIIIRPIEIFDCEVWRVPVHHILRLSNIIIRPIEIFDCEVWRVPVHHILRLSNIIIRPIEIFDCEELKIVMSLIKFKYR